MKIDTVHTRKDKSVVDSSIGVKNGTMTLST